ncbi:MAG: LPXTG cell wall anchor domain-containing protein [Clostridium sp.]
MHGVKKIASITALLLLIFSNKGVATVLPPSDVKLIGDANGLISIPEEEAFLQGNNMLPGDVVQRNMIIENKYNYSYEIFLKAERVTAKEEYDLLQKLNLSVVYNDKTIYEGPVSGEDKLINNISLGIVKPGEVKKLSCRVELDGSTTGNEYKNKYGRVDFIFTASRTEDNSNKDKPYTGDEGIGEYIIIALIGAVALAITLRNKEEE